MNAAAEYITRLEEAVRALQRENDLFRAAYESAGAQLPNGVSERRPVVEFEASAMMDESDSENEENREEESMGLMSAMSSTNTAMNVEPSYAIGTKIIINSCTFSQLDL